MERLKRFIDNNNITFDENKDGDVYICKHPWGESCLEIDIPKDGNLFLLESIQLPKRLMALKHPNCYEFIFQPTHKSALEKYGSFDFMYGGVNFHAEYKKPTSAFEMIARGIKRYQYDDTDYGNVFVFKSFYRDFDEDTKKDNENKVTKEYLPLNFFVEGDFMSMKEEEHYILFRHINFYMHYYDRECPIIYLRDTTNKEEFPNFKEHNICKIPTKIHSTRIDDTLMLLLESARATSSPRLQYLFYYQVLEYCAYYYLEENFKHKIHNILESPLFFANMDESVNILIDEFQNNYNSKSNSDAQRLERLLSTYTLFDSIKSEIVENEEYFRTECRFDGGYILDPLLTKKDTLDSCKNFYSSLRARIENIRNVLVHVRESRESKSIAPTPRNSNLLKPYIYLIRRIAEELATRTL